MKFLGLLLLLSANAFAIQTRNCPARLTVTFSDLQLNRTLGQVIDENASEHEDEIAKITAAFLSVQGTRAVTRAMDMNVARNGRCVYRPAAGRRSEEKIELYTKDGKDQLLVQSDIAAGGALLRVYAQIETLGPTRIKLFDRHAGMALAIPRHPYNSYSAGGSLIFVGKVRNITVGTN